MAITYFRYDDAGAPAIAAGDTRDVVNLIIAILTTGYTGKAGGGWTVIYNDVTNYGRVILQDPDGDHFVIHPYTYRDIEYGMCISADAAGVMVGYRSGSFNGSTGYRQRMANIYAQHAEHWYAFYDDVSHTLIFSGFDDYITDWNVARNSSAWDNQFTVYIGSLKPPVPGAFSPKVIFGGTHAQYNDDTLLFAHNTRSYAPREGHSGTILKPYADETLAGPECAFVPVAESSSNTYSAPNTTAGSQYIGLIPVNCYIARAGDGNPGLEFIGSIRGFKFFPPWLSASRSAADLPARWIDPACSGYPTMIADPLNPSDGFHYYTNGQTSAQWELVSDNPDWW